MIDTHAHLDFPQYDSDRDDVIKNGFEQGLETVVNIGVDLETSRKSIELAERYDRICATVGMFAIARCTCSRASASGPGFMVPNGVVAAQFSRLVQ